MCAVPRRKRGQRSRPGSFPVVRGAEDVVRFIPSAVEGLPGVTEAAIFTDRLELLSEGRRVVIRFLEIARWPRGAWFHRPLACVGFRVRGRPSVADRDWFRPPAERFFRFYTEPAVTVYLPDEPRELGYGETTFRRVQDVIELGGFGTFDLG